MRKLVVTAMVIGALVVLAASPATAGGWAVPAFDPLPPIQAGEPAAIGVTILQHGVHPADVEDVALVHIAGDGTTLRFAAFPEHYLGTITVGNEWSTATLVPLDDRVTGAGGGDVSGTRVAARVVLPVLAIFAAAVAFGVPRRRHAVLATP